jgi:hypothetical protein
MRSVIRLARRAIEVGPKGTVVRAAGLLLNRFPNLRLVRTALVVRDRTGKSLASQAREIVSLRRGAGRLSPLGYYAYELYDDRRYTLAEKQEFVGWRPEDLSTKLNDPHWREVCDDKLLTYAVLRGLCLPHPEVYAIYHPSGRTYGSTPSLHTPEAMADFLRREMRYPCFGKPAKDSYGGGASSIDAIDRARDVLLLRTGEEVPVEDYVRDVPVARAAGHRLRRFRSRYDSGFLFQERIVQHPIVDRLTGGRITSLRMVVLLWPDGPRLHRGTWKVAVGRNITDHLMYRSRNLKCPIDLATGRVERVVQGRGPERAPVYGLGFEGTAIEAHPDTGERLIGVQLPDWDRAVALCLHAAAAFPGIRYQAWDLALTPDGPTIVELNFNGGIGQIPGWRGVNDADFRRFLASTGGS